MKYNLIELLEIYVIIHNINLINFISKEEKININELIPYLFKKNYLKY